MRYARFCFVSFAVAVGLLLGGARRACADQLIFNGSFENGLNNWTVVAQAPAGTDNYFQNASGANTPRSGLPTPSATAGAFIAVSDQDLPVNPAIPLMTRGVLYQAFTVPSGATNIVLSFDMFVNDWNGTPPTSNGLDFGNNDNNNARVDILKGSVTDIFSTAPTDVVQNYYEGVDDLATTMAGSTNPFVSYAFPNQEIVLTPGSYILRFGHVDDSNPLNQGIDNVGLTFTSAPGGAIPEPSAILLFAIGVSGLIALRWSPRPGQLDCREAE